MNYAIAESRLVDKIKLLDTDIKAILNPVITDVEHLTVTLDVAGGAAPSVTYTDIPVTGADVLAFQFKNAGTSTTVTVDIYGSIGNTGYTSGVEVTQITMNATTTANVIKTLTNVPYDKVKIVITNTDATEGHTAIMSVTVRTIKKAITA